MDETTNRTLYMIFFAITMFLIMFYYCAILHKDEYDEMREILKKKNDDVTPAAMNESQLRALEIALNRI